MECCNAAIDVDEVRRGMPEEDVESELCNAALGFGAEDGVALYTTVRCQVSLTSSAKASLPFHSQ